MQPPTQFHEQYKYHLIAAALQITRQMLGTGAKYILMDMDQLTTRLELGYESVNLPDGLRQEVLPCIIIAVYGRTKPILYASLEDLAETLNQQKIPKLYSLSHLTQDR